MRERCTTKERSKCTRNKGGAVSGGTTKGSANPSRLWYPRTEKPTAAQREGEDREDRGEQPGAASQQAASSLRVSVPGSPNKLPRWPPKGDTAASMLRL